MDRRFVWIFIAGAFFIFAVVFFIFSYSSPANSPYEFESCKTLQYSGDNKFNILFFSDRKSSESYMNFLLDTPPFDEHKSDFNFYYIDTYNPECENYRGQAILCYSKELIRKAGSCPNDFILVLRDAGSLRSSAYMNVGSLNTNHPMTVFTHEFGHLFASLSEEYTPAPILRGSKNCVSNCDSFGGSSDGCYKGCSDSEYFRSIDSGVMRTLNSNEYGSYNLNLIRGRILDRTNSKITLFAVQESSVCSSEEYYLLHGINSLSGVEIVDKTLESGCAPYTGSGMFKYGVYAEGETIEAVEFNPAYIFTDGPGDEIIDGVTYVADGQEFYLAIPKQEDAKSVLILNLENQKLQEINVDDLDSRPCRI